MSAVTNQEVISVVPRKKRGATDKTILKCVICEIGKEAKEFQAYSYKGERKRVKTCKLCKIEGKDKMVKNYNDFMKTADEKVKKWMLRSVETSDSDIFDEVEEVNK
jgi:hypothetical protein